MDRKPAGGRRVLVQTQRVNEDEARKRPKAQYYQRARVRVKVKECTLWLCEGEEEALQEIWWRWFSLLSGQQFSLCLWMNAFLILSFSLPGVKRERDFRFSLPPDSYLYSRSDVAALTFDLQPALRRLMNKSRTWVEPFIRLLHIMENQFSFRSMSKFDFISEEIRFFCWTVSGFAEQSDITSCVHWKCRDLQDQLFFWPAETNRVI